MNIHLMMLTPLALLQQRILCRILMTAKCIICYRFGLENFNAFFVLKHTSEILCDTHSHPKYNSND